MSSATPSTDATHNQTNINLDTVYQVFTKSNVVIILWFLAIYFVVYLILNIIRGKSGANQSVARWVDIISLLAILIYLTTTYFVKSNSDKEQEVSSFYDTLKTYMNTPLSLISVGFFIFTLYIVVYILGIPMDENKPITIGLVENAAWLFFVIILISTFFNLTTKFSLTGFMDKIASYVKNKTDQLAATSVNGTVAVNADHTGNVSGNGNASSSSVSITLTQDEVFNIGNNMYTYDDAQTVCQAFGARLATYDDIENAYNNGAEWCNYGWSDGQAAYFPTQKSTWANLQKSSSMKNSCGRPGINGGFIDNPDARFGVNCYGKKPQPKPSDLNDLGNGTNIPKTPEDSILDKKIEF